MSHNLIQVEPSQLNGFIKHVADFLLSRRTQVIAARAQKGGWEGWLQVELALYLPSVLPVYNVLREESIYNANQRVDIWAQHFSGMGTPEPNIGIELKVETEYQRGVGKTLQERLRADILKCDAGPKQEFKRAPGTHLYAVGITSLHNDLEAAGGFKQVATQTGKLICYCPLVIDPTHEERNIIMIWWGKEFN